MWWEPEPADPVKFGKGLSDTTLFVSTGETEADWRALRLSRKVAKDLSISFARMRADVVATHPFRRAGGGIGKGAELSLHVCHAV